MTEPPINALAPGLRQYLPDEADDEDDWIIEEGPPRGVTDSLIEDKYAQRRRARLNKKQRVPAETPFRNQFFKTSLCKFFKSNKCQRGKACVYAHSSDELRSTPDLQKTSLCQKGKDCSTPGCPFAHSMHELRSTELFYKTASCRFHASGVCYLGNSCRYSHDSQELGEVADAVFERATSMPCSGSIRSRDNSEVSEARGLRNFAPPSSMEALTNLPEEDDQSTRSFTGESITDMFDARAPYRFTAWSIMRSTTHSQERAPPLPRMLNDPTPTSCSSPYPAAAAHQVGMAGLLLPMSPQAVEQQLRDAMPDRYEE